MDALTVSLATSRDVPKLLEMMEDFNRIEEIEWARDQGEVALRKLLSDRNLGVVGLLQEQGATVGYFVLTWGYDLEWNGRDAFITELYLLPGGRGRGLSRSFLSKIEAVARDHESHALHLMVRPENTAARRLYEGAGYESPPRIFLSKDLR
jgi:ribosomal protein S18 acetylase RimI-like enzyme